MGLQINVVLPAEDGRAVDTLPSEGIEVPASLDGRAVDTLPSEGIEVPASLDGITVLFFGSRLLAILCFFYSFLFKI